MADCPPECLKLWSALNSDRTHSKTLITFHTALARTSQKFLLEFATRTLQQPCDAGARPNKNDRKLCDVLQSTASIAYRQPAPTVSKDCGTVHFTSNHWRQHVPRLYSPQRSQLASHGFTKMRYSVFCETHLAGGDAEELCGHLSTEHVSDVINERSQWGDTLTF